MKILFITHNWPSLKFTNAHHFSHVTGYASCVHYLKKNNEVTVLTFGSENETIIDNGITIIYKKTFLRIPILYRFSLSRYAVKIAANYDIVHSLYDDTAVCFPKDRKYITTFHILPQISKYRSIKDYLFIWIKFYIIQKPIIKKKLNSIVVSNNLRILLKKLHQDSIFIPHGVNDSYWSNENIESNLYRKYLKNKFKKIILTVGYHGLDVLTYKSVIEELNDYLFIYVGRSDLPISSDNFVVKSKIPDEELKALYHICDATFRPIHFSTANNSILESMSMKKLIYTNNISGVTDYLLTDSAYLVNDPVLFAKTIRSTIDQDDINYQLIENAYLRIKEIFSWEVVAKNIELYYIDRLSNENK